MLFLIVSVLPAALAEEIPEPVCGLTEHAHTEECVSIVCGLLEQEGHVHTPDCYRTLSCEQPEAEAHIHAESCIAPVATLTCPLAEVHVHTEACMDGETPVCGLEEGATIHTHEEACWQEVPTPVCGLAETLGHTHGDECWISQEEPICGIEPAEPHTHDESCKDYICGLTEHVHTELCFADQTPPSTAEPVTVQAELLWQGPGAAERKNGEQVHFGLYRTVSMEEPVGAISNVPLQTESAEYLGEFVLEQPNWIWNSASVPELSLEARCEDGWYVYFVRLISDGVSRTGYYLPAAQDGCFTLRMVNTIPTGFRGPYDLTVSMDTGSEPAEVTLYRRQEPGTFVRLQFGTWDHDVTLLETRSYRLPQDTQIEIVAVNSTAVPVLRASERIDEYSWETFFYGKTQERNDNPDSRNLPAIAEDNKYTFTYTVGQEDVSLDMILGGTMDAAEYTFQILLPEVQPAETDIPLEAVMLEETNGWTKTWTAAELPTEADGSANLYYFQTADGAVTTYQPWLQRTEQISGTVPQDPVPEEPVPETPESAINTFDLTVVTAWVNPYGENITEEIPQETIPFDLYFRQRGNLEAPLNYWGSYAAAPEGGCVIPSLPLTDGEGMELEYIVVETGGHTATYDGNCTVGPITIVLEQPASFAVQMAWEGIDPVDSVAFALYRRELMARPSGAETEEPARPDVWVHSFSLSAPDWRWDYSSDELGALPLLGQDENGNTLFYFYYVVEQGVPEEWEVVYSDNGAGIADGTITVTNSLPVLLDDTPEEPDPNALGSITVTFPVDDVLYRIHRVGTYNAGMLILDGQFGDIDTDDLDAAAEVLEDILFLAEAQPNAYGWVSGGKTSFTQLPQGVYLVAGNRKIVDGMEYAPIPFFVFLINNGGEGDLNPVVAGRYTTSVLPTEVTALAAWDGDTEENRPAYVKAQLLKSGIPEGEPVLLSKDNDWRYTWTNLDPAELWSVLEIEVPQYYVCSAQHVENTFVLFNKRLITQVVLPALPQTGQYWWPVFVMAPLGLIFVTIGLIRRRKGKEDA